MFATCRNRFVRGHVSRHARAALLESCRRMSKASPLQVALTSALITAALGCGRVVKLDPKAEQEPDELEVELPTGALCRTLDAEDDAWAGAVKPDPEPSCAASPSGKDWPRWTNATPQGSATSWRAVQRTARPRGIPDLRRRADRLDARDPRHAREGDVRATFFVNARGDAAKGSAASTAASSTSMARRLLPRRAQAHGGRRPRARQSHARSQRSRQADRPRRSISVRRERTLDERSRWCERVVSRVRLRCSSAVRSPWTSQPQLDRRRSNDEALLVGAARA